MKKTINTEEAKEIFHGDHSDYETVEEGEWISELKYGLKDIITKDKDGIFWSIGATRLGSYHSGYEFEYDTELVQVEKKQKVIEEWEPVPEVG